MDPTDEYTGELHRLTFQIVCTDELESIGSPPYLLSSIMIQLRKGALYPGPEQTLPILAGAFPLYRWRDFFREQNIAPEDLVTKYDMQCGSGLIFIPRERADFHQYTHPLPK